MVVVLPPVELLHRAGHQLVRFRDMRGSPSGVSGDMMPTMSGGRSCVRRNAASGRAHRDRRAPPHVVVVEEDREQADVLAPRLGLLVEGRIWPRRGVVSGLTSVHLHELERLDRLRLSVLGDGEVVRVRSSAGLPLLPVTIASTRTKLIPGPEGGLRLPWRLAPAAAGSRAAGRPAARRPAGAALAPASPAARPAPAADGRAEHRPARSPPASPGFGRLASPCLGIPPAGPGVSSDETFAIAAPR